MTRLRPFRTFTAALAAAILLGGLAASARAERPRADKILPQYTVLYLSVIDAPEMSERFMNTALGKMSQDPQMKPLVAKLYGSATDAVALAEDRIGLSLPELLAIPQGELTLAIVAPDDTPPALVLLLDAGRQLSDARELVDKLDEEFTRRNVARSTETVAGTKITIYDGVGPRRRKLMLFEKDATFVLGSDLDVLKTVLDGWDGKAKARLSDNPNYAGVMRRCRGSKDEPPQFVWYADPIGIMRAFGQQNTSVQLAVAMLPALGLDGLTAVGGSLILDTEKFDSIVHAHLLLESPRSGVLDMIALESGDVTPEPWVPTDVARYTTFHWDYQQTLDALSKLYDSFQGDGALSAEIKRRFSDEMGVDLEKDILPALEGRATLVSWIERPVTIRSQATLFGLKLLDKAPIEDALKELSQRNPDSFVKETFAGVTYYQIRNRRIDELPSDRRPRLPCFGVVGDYLLMADRAVLFEEAVRSSNDSKSLADELDFKLVASKIQRQPGGKSPGLISFIRPEEGMRMLYSLATAQRSRDRLRAGAEDNRFFKALNDALEENPLPPFAVLRQYIAPGGAMVVDDDTGIHYMGFTLRRE